MAMDFGRYRTTKDTNFRSAKRFFRPSFHLDEEMHQAFRRIDRADEIVREGALDEATTMRLLRDALSKNAYGTASIEGNPLSLAEVESLLQGPPAPDSLDRPDEREILNHAAFLRTLPSRKAPESPPEVKALHAELFMGVLSDAGRLKTRPNFIGKRPEFVVIFVPTPPERVEQELEHALEWANHSDEHPLVKALVFFHEFQSIHPFRDGNGRAGRALLHVHLHSFGYTGVRYALVDYLFNEDRDGYYAALQAVHGGDFTPWIRYGAKLLADAFEDARRRIALGAELGDFAERQIQVAEWMARVSRHRKGRRVKFADIHAAFAHVPERTLKRDLALLRGAKVIVMEGVGKGTTYRYRRAD